MNVLQLKSDGNKVKLLQSLLNQLGYQIVINGAFGNQTANAVMQFQKDYNLTVDGIVGQHTYHKISSLWASNSLRGIDISRLNGEVNWETIGFEASFAYCKASQGPVFKDPKFQGYFNELKNAGIIRGAYHTLTFQNANAEEQIQNFLDCNIDFSLPGILPPILGVEWQVAATNHYDFKHRAICKQVMKEWLEGITVKTGRTPIIYTTRVFWNDYLGNPSEFNNYPLWLASYPSAQPNLPNYNTFWQNCSDKIRSNVSGKVEKR
jgi:lysozyme